LALTDHSELLNSFGFSHFLRSAPPMGLIKLNLLRTVLVPGSHPLLGVLGQG